MSDLLTHWAVFEDMRRLAALDPRMARDLVAILEAERQYARLGSVSRGGVRFVPHVLSHARAEWPAAQAAGGPARDLLARKVAYALGGIAHFPADYVLKPVMSRLAGADWNATHHAMQKGVAEAPAVAVLSPDGKAKKALLKGDTLADAEKFLEALAAVPADNSTRGEDDGQQ